MNLEDKASAPALIQMEAEAVAQGRCITRSALCVSL